MRKSTVFLTIAFVFLVGIIIGFIFSPVKYGISNNKIGSENNIGLPRSKKCKKKGNNKNKEN